MTAQPPESAVEGLRQSMACWCRNGLAEYNGRCYRELMSTWIESIDDLSLAALIGTTENADALASSCVAELGLRATNEGAPAADMAALVAHLFAGPAELPLERVHMLCGAFLGACATRTALAELERKQRHEVTSPLQAALLNLELLMIDHQSNSDLHNELGTVKQSLDTVVALVSRGHIDGASLLGHPQG